MLLPLLPTLLVPVDHLRQSLTKRLIPLGFGGFTGVSGLAVAYALSTAGHRVRVLEKFGLDRPSAGQRIPPNLSKILWQWIGPEELMKVSTRCVGSPFHRREYSCPQRAMILDNPYGLALNCSNNGEECGLSPLEACSHGGDGRRLLADARTFIHTPGIPDVSD